VTRTATTSRSARYELDTTLMTASHRITWIGCVILVGVVYGAIGIVFAFPANQRFWRLAAWAVSGVIFVSQIAYEQLWQRNSRVATAVHAALAAALGGFLLAAGATIHAAFNSDTRAVLALPYRVGSLAHHHRRARFTSSSRDRRRVGIDNRYY